MAIQGRKVTFSRPIEGFFTFQGVETHFFGRIGPFPRVGVRGGPDWPSWGSRLTTFGVPKTLWIRPSKGGPGSGPGEAVGPLFGGSRPLFEGGWTLF